MANEQPKLLTDISTGEMIKLATRVILDKAKRERIIGAAKAIAPLLDSSSVDDPQSKEAKQVVRHCRSIKEVLLEL